MPFVLTVDQIDSRGTATWSTTLAELASVRTRRPFTRTVGDEFQGLLDRPGVSGRCHPDAHARRAWHIGLGIGPVSEPLPAETRSARGPAFSAPGAVEEAKGDPSHLAWSPHPGRPRGRRRRGRLRLLAAVRSGVRRRAGRPSTRSGRAAPSGGGGRPRDQPQAVSQRLQAAQWAVEEAAIPTLPDCWTGRRRRAVNPWARGRARPLVVLAVASVRVWAPRPRGHPPAWSRVRRSLIGVLAAEVGLTGWWPLRAAVGPLGPPWSWAAAGSGPSRPC